MNLDTFAILYKQQFWLKMDLVKGELGIVHCACTEVSEHLKVYCVHTLCCEYRVLARVCSTVNCSQQLLAEGGLGAGSSCCLAVRPPQHRLHLNFTHRTSVFNWRRFKPHLSENQIWISSDGSDWTHVSQDTRYTASGLAGQTNLLFGTTTPLTALFDQTGSD